MRYTPAMRDVQPATDLQPIKASLVADLVDLININLMDALNVEAIGCPVCKGVGIVGDREDGSDATCAQCGGVGAIEAFRFDLHLLKTPRYGRLIEGFDFKQGVIVPKVRSKTQAFAQLTKILGFDKAVLEVAQTAAFTESITDAQRNQIIEQVKELALAGAL